MLFKKVLLHSAITGLMVTAAAVAQQTPAADNTKMNKGDGSKTAITADKQKNNKSDLATTQQIRKSIMKDKALSTYAHNVKIVVQDGAVTLKGPVRSQAEKDSVYGKAVAVAGDGKVDNQIEIAAK